MPVSWSESSWPLSNCVENKEEAIEVRNARLHTIGNLTLVNQRLNSSLSNSPWQDKRAGNSGAQRVGLEQ